MRVSRGVREVLMDPGKPVPPESLRMSGFKADDAGHDRAEQTCHRRRRDNPESVRQNLIFSR